MQKVWLKLVRCCVESPNIPIRAGFDRSQSVSEAGACRQVIWLFGCNLPIKLIYDLTRSVPPSASFVARVREISSDAAAESGVGGQGAINGLTDLQGLDMPQTVPGIYTGPAI